MSQHRHDSTPMGQGHGCTTRRLFNSTAGSSGSGGRMATEARSSTNNFYGRYYSSYIDYSSNFYCIIIGLGLQVVIFIEVWSLARHQGGRYQLLCLYTFIDSVYTYTSDRSGGWLLPPPPTHTHFYSLSPLTLSHTILSMCAFISGLFSFF